MMFGLALVPLTVAGGAGLDFARGMMVRQAMSDALDAASLAVGSTQGLDQSSALALAQQYFDANYKIDSTAYGTVTLSIASNGYNSTNGSVTITATDTMPTAIMRLVGINTVPISTSTTVVWGQSKLWVSLVLDNSGSMSQGDSSGSKMDALKNASGQLLTILQNASANPGDVQVSIVPFVKDVNVGTNNVNASWIDWTDWDNPPIVNQATAVYQSDNDIMPSGDPLKSYGPGDKCPYDGSAGYLCAPSPVNDPNCSSGGWGGDCISTIASSGSTKGYICPGMHGGGTSDGLPYHFYNGCWVGSTWDGTYSTVKTCNAHSGSNCSCTGYGSSKTCKAKNYPHKWVANNHSTWGGCIMDRQWASAAGMDYDVTNTAPSTSNANTRFPAENNAYCLPATVTPLNYNWSTLNSQIQAMQPKGSTNQAIGFEHGWQTLTPGAPYGAPSVPANTARYIILLSDGLNTQDRWWGNGSTENTVQDGYIDAREEKACDNAKADGVIIYTILLDVGNVEGSSPPLQYCASDASKYFHLTTTSAVVTTFNQIAAQITNVRVSK